MSNHGMNKAWHYTKKSLAIFFKILGTLLLVGIISLLIFSSLFVKYVNEDLTQAEDFVVDSFVLDETSTIYYTDPQTGEYQELQQLYGDENRVWASIDKIPRDLYYATIAIEDRRFEDHQGVDWLRTASASLNMFLGSNSAYGGSTITQQLIKNLTKEDEVTVRRKLVEIFRALEFEKTHSKPQIMEWYLNTIYLGQGCYGVQSASRVYFGKDVSDLTLAECASLIAITNNPSIYDPYINEEKNRSRQLTILEEMLDQGSITQAEHAGAVNQDMIFVNTSGQGQTGGFYSYFVDQVVRDVTYDLMEKTGFSAAVVNQMVKAGGYKIYTTLNPDVQAEVDAVYENLTNIPSTQSLQQLQSGIVILDNETGDVVAMAGGVGQKTGSLTFNRATQALLSPGSTIKPVAVYAPALEQGIITPYTIYDDTPYQFSGGSAWPNNESRKFTGLMTVDEAMQHSTNTVAVKVLADAGVDHCFTFARDVMMLDTLEENLVKNGQVYSDLNLAPLALGDLTTGVTVEEMAAAYGVFANEGVYRTPRCYTQVVDSEGKVILDNTQEHHVAVSEKTAWYSTHMLENVVATGTGTGAKIPGMDVAGKTGTTTSDRDRWFCGYTPYYTAAVWCGYDLPEEIILTEDDRNPAVTLWQQVMEGVHEPLADKGFSQPAQVVSVAYCKDSGLKPTSLCEQDLRGSRVAYGLMYAEDAPKSSCDVHIAVDICEVTGNAANEYCKEQGHVTKQVSLLNLVRGFPILGVTVADQQYAFYEEDSVPAGYYPALSATVNPATVVCTVHGFVPEPEPEPEPVEPETPPLVLPHLEEEETEPTPSEPTEEE